MLYTEKTIKALKLCYDAYLGQYDVSGFPYVFHPFHLAEQMNDEMSIAVTLLHYVLEDTDLTLEELATQDFGDEIITALRVMIRDRSTSYHQYLDEVKKNVCAKKAILNELEYKKELLELKPKLKFDDISRLDSYNDGIRYLKEDNIKKENDVQEQTVPAQPVETEEEQEQVGYDVSERTVPTKKIINYSEELKKNEEKGKSTPRIKLSDPDITKRPRPQEPKEKSKKKEPDKIVYEGKTYLRYSDKWSDSSHVIVPENAFLHLKPVCLLGADAFRAYAEKAAVRDPDATGVHPVELKKALPRPVPQESQAFQVHAAQPAVLDRQEVGNAARVQVFPDGGMTEDIPG